MQQAPLSPDVDIHSMRKLTHGCDDRTWTNRMLLHLADAVTYCHAEERSTATYDRLTSYSATWMESRPPSFNPVYVRTLLGTMFPQIWLLNDVVVAGLQYYHLVKILLLSHNPRVPLLGAAQRTAKERGDALIREDVRTICGIAESMDGVHPAHLVACMAISLVGDRFTERDEQTALLRLLTKTRDTFGWSASFAIRYLQESWSWA
ncbi:hypothetical protein JDV02_001939 [Purpureocillium takamizusanense]|uniref:Uncharacterized protein n=1 Tax=Purpureocillium takamizusanense TaxID=2060973 RepID=A0A9Q8QAC1_9HYPO|nr:uncharacterized protein JDV02_001939 [Purpureocillium takamizusanense]UNI15404.1 hypothetical protein JDV02_001939 [Purpureocillium takamizusanense]